MTEETRLSVMDGADVFSDDEGQIKVDPLTGLATLALSLALKYHDINTVQDGALYQQYKLEGRNMHGLHLDMVFETAMQIERHLASSPKRIISAMFDEVDEADLAEHQPAEDDEAGKP